jgi:hypothetical protein
MPGKPARDLDAILESNCVMFEEATMFNACPGADRIAI